MRVFYVSVISALALIYGALLWLNFYGQIQVVEIYARTLRAPLFTGFLTIGGFLLSLKTFILLRLKEGLYDHPRYKERFAENFALDDTLAYYGPLDQLGRALICSVVGALIASISQLTLGLFENIYTVSWCLASAIVGFGLVLFVWWQVTRSLDMWFKIINEEKDSENRAAK